MTTKEEVLRLARAAGFHINLGAIYSPSTWNECNVQITKLIELAKQAERESWASCALSFEQIESLFPDGGNVTESGITVSAQWLHDFAKNVTSVFLRRVTPL